MNVVNAIIEERSKNGTFDSIYDFVERVNISALNRRVIEALAFSGAFDCFTELKREDFLEPNAKDETFAEQLMRYGQLFQADKQSQTASLFGDFDDPGITAAGRPAIKAAVPWVDAVRLEKERELVGMYLSAHPLDGYFMELTYGCSTTVKGFTEMAPVDGKEISFGGMVVEFTSRPARNGGQFGIMKIEDSTGSTELRLFGRQYIDFGKYGVPGTPIMITGKFQKRAYKDEVEFVILSINLLTDVKGRLIRGITLHVNVEQVNDTLCALVDEHLTSTTDDCGELRVRILEPGTNRAVILTAGVPIPINRRLIELLDELQIDYNVERCSIAG
jgi:DNA polymerase-3 subunit alpha